MLLVRDYCKSGQAQLVILVVVLGRASVVGFIDNLKILFSLGNGTEVLL